MASTLFQSGAGGGAGLEAYAAETISASGTITTLASGIQYRPIAGNGGAVTTATAPFGTSIQWQDGTTIILKGTDATNTVTINHSDTTDGPILNGNAVIGLNDILELIYDSSIERWVERGRNF